jgi:hypothetical protein
VVESSESLGADIGIEDEGCGVGGAGSVNESDGVVVSGESLLVWRFSGAMITASVASSRSSRVAMRGQEVKDKWVVFEAVGRLRMYLLKGWLGCPLQFLQQGQSDWQRQPLQTPLSSHWQEHQAEGRLRVGGPG